MVHCWYAITFEGREGHFIGIVGPFWAKADMERYLTGYVQDPKRDHYEILKVPELPTGEEVEITDKMDIDINEESSPIVDAIKSVAETKSDSEEVTKPLFDIDED